MKWCSICEVSNKATTYSLCLVCIFELVLVERSCFGVWTVSNQKSDLSSCKKNCCESCCSIKTLTNTYQLTVIIPACMVPTSLSNECSTAVPRFFAVLVFSTQYIEQSHANIPQTC